jgi:t-SNARE complex subunit (syntaxin)
MSKFDNYKKYNESSQLLTLDNADQHYFTQRTEDIKTIARDVNDTAGLFVELQELIVDQGITIDNIESNIETTKKDVNDGRENLVEAKENQGNPCSWSDPKLYFIIFLTIGIIIFIIYVVVKYTQTPTQTLTPTQTPI